MGKNYTKGTADIFPSGVADLQAPLTGQELTNLLTENNSFVSSSFSSGEKGVLLFKEALVSGVTNISRRWTGKIDTGTISAMIYLQAYNFTTSKWITLDGNSVEDANSIFTLTGTITGASDYIDGNDNAYFRIIQSETKNTNVWTMAVIPDTQKLVRERTAHCVSHWNTLMQYLVDNKTAKNIQICSHLGDVCDQVVISTEWARAASGVNIALNGDLPMIWCVGNHDYDSNPDGSASRAITYMGTYVPYATYSAKSWFGASTWPANSMRNTYAVKTIAGQKWLFFSLEFFPRSEAISWANGVITAEAPDFITVSTHGYLRADGELMGWSDVHGPGAYGLCNTEGSTVCHSGVALWNNFISQHQEIVLVFSGHTYPTTTCSGAELPAGGGTNNEAAAHNIKTSVHGNGNICTQIVCNFQNSYCYKEPWVLGKSYVQWTGQNTPVLDETQTLCTSRLAPGHTYMYAAKSNHVSTAETEPEVGANWTSYWTKYTTGTCGMSANICFFEIDPDRRTITRYDYNPVIGVSPQNYPFDNYPTKQPDWHGRHSFTFKY